MQTYRLTFSIVNGMSGCINNNTFFGLFCEAYKRLHGVDSLEVMLEDLYNSNSTLAFSNPLEVGTFDFANFIVDEIPHARLTRDTEGVNELFVVEEKHIEKFDVLCITDLEDFEFVVESFKNMSIGSRKNVGKGLIKNIDIIKIELPDIRKTSMLLSNIVPSSDFTMYGNFDYITRKGYTTKGSRQPSVVLIKAGSELAGCSSHVVGKILKFEDSYLNGMGVVV